MLGFRNTPFLVDWTVTVLRFLLLCLHAKLLPTEERKSVATPVCLAAYMKRCSEDFIRNDIFCLFLAMKAFWRCCWQTESDGFGRFPAPAKKGLPVPTLPVSHRHARLLFGHARYASETDIINFFWILIMDAKLLTIHAQSVNAERSEQGLVVVGIQIKKLVLDFNVFISLEPIFLKSQLSLIIKILQKRLPILAVAWFL